MATYVTGRVIQNETIATEDLQPGVGVPTGAVMSFAMSAAPVGWYPCDGSTVSRTGSGANLFAAIGTIYGAGDTSTTFNVPNLQGLFVRGLTTNFSTSSRDPLSATRVLGNVQSYGTAKPINPTNRLVTSGSSSLTNATAPHTVGFVRVSKTGETVTSASVDAPGSGQEIDIFNVMDGDPETRPVNITLLYCIKL